MSKLLEHYPALTNIFRRIAIDAGEIAYDHQMILQDADVEQKSDGSQVTIADKATEAHIHQELKKILPDVPFVGEESEYATNKDASLADETYYILVDPIDNTNGYIELNNDYTVNIALIKNGVPVIGVVYAPATGILYAGYEGGKAIKWDDDKKTEKEIRVAKLNNSGITVITSKSNRDKAKLDEFLEDYKVKKIIKMGSSLKMCMVAEGKADMYARFGDTSEWDIAAGHAVLNAAGGSIKTLDGNVMSYGGEKDTFLNPSFIASNHDWMPEI